ncbi:MAG: hypothetical protein AAFZ99_07780 [Pseudomonadota bacterium]
MFEALRVLAGLFAAYPIPFAISTVIIVTALYYKWVWMGRAGKNAIKNNYAGWKVDGAVDTAQRLVMRPVKIRRTGIWTLLFFGGGALFFALVSIPNGDMGREQWFAFAAMIVFSIGAVWLILMSFNRITFDGEVFTRVGVLGRNTAMRVDTLTDVRPIGKTIAGGVFLDFEGGEKLRVPANMSGYRQLLEILTQHQPKLRMLVRAYANAAQRQL